MLDTLTPAERLAFVLHDLFAVPFEEVGEVVGRTPAAARQLASLARGRLRVDGRTGLAVLFDGRVERTLAFTFVQERIAVIDIVTEHARVEASEVEIL